MKDSYIKKVIFRTQFFNSEEFRNSIVIDETCSLDAPILLTGEVAAKILQAALAGEDFGAEQKAELVDISMHYFFNAELNVRFTACCEADKDYHQVLCAELYKLLYSEEDYSSRSLSMELPGKVVKFQ